jgi:hypothetical protein
MQGTKDKIYPSKMCSQWPTSSTRSHLLIAHSVMKSSVD